MRGEGKGLSGAGVLGTRPTKADKCTPLCCPSSSILYKELLTLFLTEGVFILCKILNRRYFLVPPKVVKSVFYINPKSQSEAIYWHNKNGTFFLQKTHFLLVVKNQEMCKKYTGSRTLSIRMDLF